MSHQQDLSNQTPKQRLAAYLKDLELEDLDRLIRRLGRAPRSTTPEKKKETTTLAKYMMHKDFKPAIKAKLIELFSAHGQGIFKNSGALRKCPARQEYLAWYIAERSGHIASHEKSLDQAYYERQGLALARMVVQEHRADFTAASA
jgi:hypothetical protein